jgi:serpin B
MNTWYSQPQSLSKIEMPTAFTGAADFSDMDGTGGRYIDDSIHQAFVEVNKKGTETAATTTIVLLTSKSLSEVVPVFQADHLFIFFIQESETRDILFMGRVSDPSG